MKPLFPLHSKFPILPLLLCLSCAGPPPIREVPAPAAPVSLPDPVLDLVFDRVQAADPGHITLFFDLGIENRRSGRAGTDLLAWRFRLNGLEPSGGAALVFEDDGASIAAGASVRFPVRLELDMAEIDPAEALSPGGPDPGEYRAELDLVLGFNFGSGGDAELEAGVEALFPRVLEPRFSITSIAVSKAELINTRLKVRLRIDNPNPFPVELSTFRYELYGAGRFWAEGAREDLLRIAPGEAAERDLSLVMNFINMRRELLDDIIAMGQVAYRFKGEAAVSTGIDYLPQFRASFDRAGKTRVVE